jgi:transcriptional regulator with PAS, ATPase and Fis domain
MTSQLLVYSRDPRLVEQLRNGLADRFEVAVLDSLEAADQPPLGGKPRALLAHLGSQTLNGDSADTVVTRLRRNLKSTPIYGLLEANCSADLRAKADRLTQGCLSMPEDLPRLAELLDDLGSPGIDLAGFCTGLPHRVLKGQTRSLVTFTPSMFDMFDELKVAASHDVTILLVGETGSGKTYLARLIHELSGRHSQRCLTVGCGALPPDLIESELFGYVKGAFTGADADKQGKFAAVAGGSLLLDEIDVLAPKQQAKLLRVIETGEYEPVGSNDTQISKARLIVASNVDLEKLVKANKFRLDLFYRLNMLSFYLPPLRERPWDIEYLARRFAIDHGRAHQMELKHIEPEFLAALRQYHWPGNIRELENVIRRAVLYCRGGVLTPADLPSSMRPTTGATPVGGYGRKSLTLEQRVEEVERRIIEESLRRHNYHRIDTANELGISRVTLYNKMKKFGMLN